MYRCSGRTFTFCLLVFVSSSYVPVASYNIVAKEVLFLVDTSRDGEDTAENEISDFRYYM